MEVLKDIFVSYDIAVQLKKIGFNEPCMAYYNKVDDNPILNEYRYNPIKHNGLLIYLSAPAWAQVKKWFREKGYESNVRAYFGCYYGTIGESEDIQLEQEKTYEEAQEKLILKLIEVYKNAKK